MCAISRADPTPSTPYYNPGRIRRFPPPRVPATTLSKLDIIDDRCENVAF